MYCTQCGTKNQDDSNFCAKCGTRLRMARSPLLVEEEPEPQPVDEARVSRLLDRAFELYDNGNVEQAFEVCRAALRLNPDSVSGRSLLSTIYEKKGDLEAAIRQMERVVELNAESTADVNRLESLRKRQKSAKAAAEGQPAASGASTGPRVLSSQLLKNPRVLVAALAVAFVCIALAGIFSLMRGRPASQQAMATAPPAGAQQAPAAGATQPGQTGDMVGGSQPASPATGGVFDGLGGPTETSAAPRAEARQTQPVERREIPQPVRETPRAAATPAPAATPRPAAVRVVPQPAPSVVTTPAPQPRIRIIRETAPAPSPTAEQPRPTTGNGLSGRDYQKIAMDFKNSGDRVNAASNFHKAVEAYRAEAARGGGGFQAQQGIRTCQTELALLGESR